MTTIPSDFSPFCPAPLRAPSANRAGAVLLLLTLMAWPLGCWALG